LTGFNTDSLVKLTRFEAYNNSFSDLSFSNKGISFELDNFIYKKNKIMFYNYEINNIYYWINKIYNNWEFTVYKTDTYILIDYFLINIKDKRIEKIDNSLQDDFFNLKFDKIIIKKDKDNIFESDEDEENTLIIYKQWK